MLYRIRHSTRFSYAEPAYESHNEARLRPHSGGRQRCLSFRLIVEPEANFFSYRDYFGNWVEVVALHDPHMEASITAESLVETDPPPDEESEDLPFENFLTEDLTRTREHYEYLSPSAYVPFSDRLKRFFWMVHPEPDEGVIAYSDRLVRLVRDQFAYEPGKTNVHSNLDEILTAGAGVCQDFAHLTLGLMRLAGIPCRYVSGYLAPLRGGIVQGEQASHAWIEALLPANGWVGFDPTHGSRTAVNHIRIAIGRDYTDATPLRGTFRSGDAGNAMTVALQVEPIEPDRVPRLSSDQ